MKHVSIILNVILVVAVAVLFYLHFSGGETKEASEDSLASDSLGVSMEDINIAYINQDTLLNNYKYYKKEQDRLEKKSLELENRYKGRVEGLQEEMQYFQQNRGNMTINQAKAQQENLMKKQQNLRMYEQKLSQELMQLNTESQDKVYEKVSKYLQDYSKEHDLQLILTYQRGSGVWYAHDAMNITEDVIEGINKRYEEVKSGGSDAEEAETETTSDD